MKIISDNIKIKKEQKNNFIKLTIKMRRNEEQKHCKTHEI